MRLGALAAIDLTFSSGGQRGATLGQSLKDLYQEEMAQSEAGYQNPGLGYPTQITYQFGQGGPSFTFDAANETYPGLTPGGVDLGWQTFLAWAGANSQAVIAAYTWVNNQPKNSSEGIAGLILPALMLGVGALALTGAGLGVAGSSSTAATTGEASVTSTAAPVETATVTPVTSADASTLAGEGIPSSAIGSPLASGASALTSAATPSASTVTQAASTGSSVGGGSAASTAETAAGSSTSWLTSGAGLVKSAAPLIAGGAGLLSRLTGHGITAPPAYPVAATGRTINPLWIGAGVLLLAFTLKPKSGKGSEKGKHHAHG